LIRVDCQPIKGGVIEREVRGKIEPARQCFQVLRRRRTIRGEPAYSSIPGVARWAPILGRSIGIVAGRRRIGARASAPRASAATAAAPKNQ
jgi:hypothetical protein